ncbi:dolichol-phosphate mannosyltransferase [Nocardioides exalbidus]|uniref:Dolichol-phosphate mannosyltransferase n=1 Tax=Nocardioides exalbidus TaxID=402596 RepID=A0A1H4SF78_9ACTN|nr:glycosyltransferase family 2 protein [Nocardioides exalbidus]SEC42694.1 dolichol-phosphate mannosyltransferase [Nocardioides exalbidus]
MTDAPSSARRRIAYLLPVYNEESGVPAFHAALVAATDTLADRYDVQFIYVDDGSRDRSFDVLMRLHEQDERVVVIRLSRNFGHQKAVTAALDACHADAAIIMDTDLQDPPAVSLELIERWEAGADVVYAQRRTRDDSWFKRTTAHAFYRVLSRAASIDIPRDTGDFRLLDRTVVAELGKYREHNRFLRGMVSHVGFRQEAVAFDRDRRHSGTTGYPLSKMLSLAGDGIFGFSTAPLRLISRVGLLFSLLSVVGIVYAVVVRLATPENAVPGWAFLAITLFLIGGVQISMLGILGSYLGRVYIEVQDRPLYSVSRVVGDPW